MEGLLYWHWLAFGLILVIAETLGAAGFLVALGMAAGTTGLLTLLFNLDWQWQLVCFSISCVLFAVGWWQFLRTRVAGRAPSLLNQPFESMLGRTATLIEAIDNGRGKIRINDANWFVTGPALPAGTKVLVIGIEEGTLLVVEPLPADL